MNTAFSLEENGWAIQWPGRVARHDLVYHSPPVDPTQGIPLGNGDLGAILWCEPMRLVLQLNKSDLWDDSAFGHFNIGGHRAEEDVTGLRHASRLYLELQQPLLDPLYLCEFEARLSLADATLHLRASGPLGTLTVRTFIGRDPSVLWLEAVTDSASACPQRIVLERYGSRAFSRWYSMVCRDPSIRLSGTEIHVGTDQAQITQALNPGRFAVGFTMALDVPAPAYERLHDHAAAACFSAAKKQTFILVAACTSPREHDPAPELADRLANACATGFDAAHRLHVAEWQAFWRRSFMDCGDDYLNNLWHLTMYYLNASQRGAWPGRFINGLWSWNRDVQPWLCYFHWNQQTLYWPLHAAGHHDLLEPYLQFRFRGLEHARRDAREFFQAEGAFVCDITDRRGVNSKDERGNHTPVAEIALDFWRQYCYTGDRGFLQTQALPYLIEAALFFESRFQKGVDGLYHAQDGTACEGAVRFRDVISELVAGRALFAALLEALAEAGATHPHAGLWRDMMEKLAPLPVAEADPDLISQRHGCWRLNHGWFKGARLASNRLLAVGFRMDLGKVVIGLAPNRSKPPPMPDVHALFPMLETAFLRQDTPMNYVDVFPEVEYLSVFPSSLISLANRGEPLFDAAVNTLKLYAPGLGGYDRMPVAMARLGLGSEAWRVIGSMPGRWQFYVNGFGHYNWGMKSDQALRFYQLNPVDAADGKTRQLMAAADFRHMGMESMSVLCTAINECLLQSHGGIIRVAPAIERSRTARFTLHAEGGFVVSCDVRKGQPSWVLIESRRGGTCRIMKPWKRCYRFRATAGAPTFAAAGDSVKSLIEGEMAPGERWLLAPSARLMQQWTCIAETPAANMASKTAPGGHPRLGLPNLF